MANFAVFLGIVTLLGVVSAKPSLFPSSVDVFSSGRQELISYRLPNNTFPLHYSVHLSSRVDIEDFNFSGHVTIQIGVAEPSNSITVHARQINIDSVALTKVSEPTTAIKVSFEVNMVQDFLIITSEDQLSAGDEYLLDINYSGVLREDSYGFYKASYIDENGKTHYVATTQFAATEARHAFPCYDEPRLRSTFDVSVTHGRNYFSVGNMPVKEVNE